MKLKKSVHILWLFLLFAQTLANEGGEHPLTTHDNSETEHKEGDHGAEGGEHHGGVNLASWRWDEYNSIITFLLMIIIVGLLKIAFHHIPCLHHHFPESCVLMIIGVLVGVIVYCIFESQSQYFPKFTSHLFFNVLLPPIILDAAYALYDREFLSNFFSVVLYAVVGTLFNVFAIGGLLYGVYCLGWMGDFEMPLDAISCLVFSSLISAVDPVAVLAIFEEIGVNMGLYFLVFGESLLNDGVTVVLYNTMIALSGLEPIPYIQYILAFFSFFTVVFGGLTIGCIIGAISAFILKFTKDTRVIEPLIIFATSYMAFILSETIHWSGIISLIGCGVVQKRYAFPNISKKSYTTVKYSVKTLAAFSDCIIFLFLGIVTASKKLEWHTGFVLWTVAFCTVVRFIGVFVLSFFVNMRRVKQITLREQFIMAYGGLRGAVGFSLALILPESEFKPIFLTATLTMIFFTVFLQGGTIKILVRKLNIARKTTGAKMISTDVNEKTIEHVMAGIESIIGRHSRRRLFQKFRDFDNNYTKPLLIRKDAEDIMALRFQRISLDEHYARLYGPAVMIHENAHLHDQDKETKPDVSGEMSAKDRKLLNDALSNTAFSKYMKRTGKEEPVDILKDLKNDNDVRFNRLRHTLSKERRRKLRVSAPDKLPEEDDGSDYDEENTGAQSKQLLRPNSYISNDSVRGMDADSIRRRYRMAKEEFKHGSGSERSSYYRRESDWSSARKPSTRIDEQDETQL